MRRARTVLLLIVAMAMMLSGCTPAEKRSAEPVPEKKYGGTFVFALPSDVTNLVPLLATDNTSSTVSNQIYEGLTRYEGNYKMVGALARSWEVSADGKTWTFKLRDGITWHDATPFTSADVKYTYDRLLDANTKSPKRKNYTFIRHVETPDELTVRFVLLEPHGAFLDKMTLGIISKKHGEQVGTLDAYDHNPVGTGPFRYKEWIREERIVLEANTSYWQGRPYLDKVIFKPLPDHHQRLQALRKGEVHYMSSLSVDDLRRLESPERFEVFRVPALSFAYLALNNQNPLFRDIRVKEALASAVDKNTIIREVLGGLAVPSSGPYSPANEYYHNPGVKKFAYNPDLARQLLDAAGYKPGRDQLRQNVLGKKLEFSVMVRSGDEMWKQIATLCQKWFLDIGVKMNIEYVDWATMNRRLDERDYESAMLSFVPGPDPDQYNLWHSSAIDGGFNDWCYKNPDVDKLLEQGRRESEPAIRKAIYFKVQEVLAADVAAIWLYHPYTLSVLDQKYKGMVPEPMGQDRYLHRLYELEYKRK